MIRRGNDGPDEAKVEGVVQHLSSLKELVAAGLRSSDLVSQMLLKLPMEHRQQCIAVSTKLRSLLLPVEISSDNGGTAAVSRRNSSALSPPASGRTSPTPISPSGRSTLRQALFGPQSPPATSSSTPAPLSPIAPRLEVLPSVLFRQAILGSCDPPQEIGMEKMPRPGTPGLMSGDLRPLRQFLLLPSSGDIVEYLHGVLGESDSLDALSFANMMWVQTHPNDFEAAAIDNARISAGLKRKSVSSSLAASGSGTSSRNLSKYDNGGFGATLEDSMKYLLFLNLSLRFHPDEWTELLQMRDDRLHLLKQLQGDLAAAVAASGVAVMQFPSVVKTMSALDAALSGTSLLSISAQPADIHSILFNRYSALVVDLGFVLHDHPDVSKVKRLNAVLEKTCAEAVDALKQSLRVLGELEAAIGKSHASAASSSSS